MDLQSENVQLDIEQLKGYPTLVDLLNLQSKTLRFQPFEPNSLHPIMGWYFEEKVKADHSLDLNYTETLNHRGAKSYPICMCKS